MIKNLNNLIFLQWTWLCRPLPDHLPVLDGKAVWFYHKLQDQEFLALLAFRRKQLKSEQLKLQKSV
ncbi:hypothetical protein [Nitrosomonas ureae]|uniref:hypothetical protein n=1 Tax=Nitrosomonas ureae TaxID=44577 RepID=UPI0015577631|nr:hypothetical protein [Nitrosomonas ureae]